MRVRPARTWHHLLQGAAPTTLIPVYQNDHGLYIARTVTVCELITGRRAQNPAERGDRPDRAARWGPRRPARSGQRQQPGSLKLAMRVCQPLPSGAVAAPAAV
jgi:hypothetical protein